MQARRCSYSRIFFVLLLIFAATPVNGVSVAYGGQKFARLDLRPVVYVARSDHRAQQEAMRDFAWCLVVSAAILVEHALGSVSTSELNNAHFVAGYSADAVISYISALARKAPNVNALVSDLQAQVNTNHHLQHSLADTVHGCTFCLAFANNIHKLAAACILFSSHPMFTALRILLLPAY